MNKKASSSQFARGGGLLDHVRGPPRPDGRYTGGYTSNEVDYQYDEGYDALLGAQMHLPQFKNSPYGPWEMASAAVLYPSPFDETTYGNWPSRHTPGSTNSMDHFIAYVKGATGSVKTHVPWPKRSMQNCGTFFQMRWRRRAKTARQPTTKWLSF